MTKIELLTWLGDQPWCASVGEPEIVDASSGWQKVIVREVYENTAITRAIHFYETPDGCYWKDAEPSATLAPQPASPTYKMITFRTILNAIGIDAYTPMRMRIAAAADQSVAMADIQKMLETYGPDGGIDINAESTKTMVQSLVASGTLTQVEADAVIALAD